MIINDYHHHLLLTCVSPYLNALSKDVRLPVQLQRAMAAEAEAAREARAKVIAAEGEQKASRALKEASDVIAESPAALQLRYLQVGENYCVLRIVALLANVTCLLFLFLTTSSFTHDTSILPDTISRTKSWNLGIGVQYK